MLAANSAALAGATPMVCLLRSCSPDPPDRPRSYHYGWPAVRRKSYTDARGKYRVFNSAVYRLYRSQTGPPAESDTPFATAGSLPATPAVAWADGTWYLSMSFFNGVLDSGFLPLGPSGETYLRIDLVAGEQINSPPAAPLSWHLEQRPAGVVRVCGIYFEAGSLRADTWAIAYTTNGTEPPEDTPTVTATIAAGGLVVLEYDLPAQAEGTRVRVRLQTRRTLTSYSEGSGVLETIAKVAGVEAPAGSGEYPGRLPVEV